MIDGTYAMTVHAHNLDDAARFYGGLLALPELHRDAEVALFAIPGSPPLSVHKWGQACEQAGGRPPGTVSGIMLRVANAAETCRRLSAGGGTVTAPPFPGPRGGAWCAIADFDGNELMLCEPDAA